MHKWRCMMKSNLSAAFCQRESPGAVPPDPCTQLCSLFQGLTDTQRSFPLAFSKYPSTTFLKSMGLFRLEKTFQIKSSSSPSTKCPWEPHPHGFSIPAGVVAPSLPCSLPSLPWTQQSCCFVPLEIAPQTPGSFGHRVGSSLTVPRVLRPWAITLKSFQTISHPLDQLMSPQAVCLLCECLFLTSWLKTLWGTLEMCSLWNQTALKLIPKAAGQLSPHPMQSLLWQLRLQKWILCAAHAISTSCAKSSLFIINQFC